jgi:hypothetical protein
VSDFSRIWIFSADFLIKVPSAKFHGNPFSKSGAYTGARRDGLTGHDEANGLLSRLSERAWKRRGFPWRRCGRDVNLTNRLHVIQRLKMRGATLPLLIYLHGKVLNEGDGRLNFPYHSGVQNQCLFLACRRIIDIQFFLERATNALGYMNVILLHSNRSHVSATHVAILRVGTITIQIQL